MRNKAGPDDRSVIHHVASGPVLGNSGVLPEKFFESFHWE